MQKNLRYIVLLCCYVFNSVVFLNTGTVFLNKNCNYYTLYYKYFSLRHQDSVM